VPIGEKFSSNTQLIEPTPSQTIPSSLPSSLPSPPTPPPQPIPPVL
jgi:hypothetical protein